MTKELYKPPSQIITDPEKWSLMKCFCGETHRFRVMIHVTGVRLNCTCGRAYWLESIGGVKVQDA